MELTAMLSVLGALVGIAVAAPAPTSTSTSRATPSPKPFQPLFRLQVDWSSNSSYTGLWMSTSPNLQRYAIFKPNISDATVWYNWYFADQIPHGSGTLVNNATNYPLGVSNGDWTGEPFSASAFSKPFDEYFPPAGLQSGFIYNFNMNYLTHDVSFNQTEDGEMDQTKTQVCDSPFNPPNRFIVTHDEQAECAAIKLKWRFAGVHLPFSREAGER